MTYKDQFVVEVKCQGKILRVKDDVVSLPFGSEYSIFLKNLNSRRASIKIHIDGQDVLDYSSLILEPNSSTELKGFLSGTTAHNKFKFIQKTKEVQEHRGDKIDDGLIRVEFAFEKAKKRVILTEHHHEYHDHHHHHSDHYHYPNPFRWNYNDWFNGDVSVQYSNTTLRGSSGEPVVSTFNVSSGVDERGLHSMVESNVTFDSDSLGVESLGTPLDDEGITVKGSECHQSFRYASMGELDEAEVVVIRMRGFQGSSGIAIHHPVTTSTRLICSSCGKKSKSSFKYCPNCGTYLE